MIRIDWSDSSLCYDVHTLGSDSSITQLASRARDGDAAAREQLVAHVFDRVQRLVGSKLRDFPRVQRWERQSDVFQNVMLTLHQKLGKIEFKDTRHFFRLSGVLVRRELVNLHRHHYGPQGHAAHHVTQGISPGGSDPSDATPAAAIERDAASDSSDPVEVLQTLEVHQHVGRLPKDLREVVGLLYYHGLSPAEAADVMKVSRRTVDRLWDKARARLGRAIRG